MISSFATIYCRRWVKHLLVSYSLLGFRHMFTRLQHEGAARFSESPIFTSLCQCGHTVYSILTFSKNYRIHRRVVLYPGQGRIVHARHISCLPAPTLGVCRFMQFRMIRIEWEEGSYPPFRHKKPDVTVPGYSTETNVQFTNRTS